jgi:fumarate hydratase class II
MDAVPMTLGQELSGWAAHVEADLARLGDGSKRPLLIAYDLLIQLSLLTAATEALEHKAIALMEVDQAALLQRARRNAMLTMPHADE